MKKLLIVISLFLLTSVAQAGVNVGISGMRMAIDVEGSEYSILSSNAAFIVLNSELINTVPLTYILPAKSKPILIASGFASTALLDALGNVILISDSCLNVVDTIKKINSKNTTSINGVISKLNSSLFFDLKFINSIFIANYHFLEYHA